MELTIYWTKFAENELNKIFIYYRDKVNLKTAKKISKEIVISAIQLKKFP